jgi:hypothetical protein
MSRIPVALLAIALSAGLAACGDDSPGNDDGTVRDTTITTVPDTIMIERTTTVDTVRDPDLDRDTAHHDTVAHDTIRR